MIGFKINVLLTRLVDKVLNMIGIHIATFIKGKFFFSVFEAISVITPGKQNYTIPKAFRFCNKIILNFSSPIKLTVKLTNISKKKAVLGIVFLAQAKYFLFQT